MPLSPAPDSRVRVLRINVAEQPLVIGFVAKIAIIWTR